MSVDNSHPSFLSDEVSKRWTDAVLIVGCLATGLLDSAVLNTWQCFVSMQTGNTVYVGLGISGQPAASPWRWAKSGTSILAFAVGSFVFGRLMRRMEPLRRSTLFTTGLLQAVLAIAAALLSTLRIIPDAEMASEAYIVLLPLALLAIQAGGQCVLSRVLGFGEVPTVVVTASLCDIGMDEKLFQGISDNSKRNRRVLSVLMLLGGAVIGGFMTRDGEVQWALWLVAGIKLLMAGAWLLWPADQGIRLD